MEEKTIISGNIADDSPYSILTLLGFSVGLAGLVWMTYLLPYSEKGHIHTFVITFSFICFAGLTLVNFCEILRAVIVAAIKEGKEG